MDKDFLTPTSDENNEGDKKFILLVFIFIGTLIILISTVSFAIFSKYNVGTDDNSIDAGSVLFSFNEGSNYINLIDTLPMSDEIGKQMSASNQYFDFDVSVGFDENKKQDEITYEISLVPLEGNTVSQDMIRVYLEENGEAVAINDKLVNNFSDLVNNVKKDNAKFLIKRTLADTKVNHYRFRMWLSDKYKLDDIKRTFKCYVAVDAY